jgi:hypothetical protein
VRSIGRTDIIDRFKLCIADQIDIFCRDHQCGVLRQGKASEQVPRK